MNGLAIGTPVRCVRRTGTGIEVGDTGVYTFGADYVPGWDAGRFDVTLDEPVKWPDEYGDVGHRLKVQSHWTLTELLMYWQPVAS